MAYVLKNNYAFVIVFCLFCFIITVVVKTFDSTCNFQYFNYTLKIHKNIPICTFCIFLFILYFAILQSNYFILFKSDFALSKANKLLFIFVRSLFFFKVINELIKHRLKLFPPSSITTFIFYIGNLLLLFVLFRLITILFYYYY